ncbi:MAG: hypothetical protein II920_00915 [Clostridia bacterium]|nr:hypothetical protein [Clostridia bacterium]
MERQTRKSIGRGCLYALMTLIIGAAVFFCLALSWDYVRGHTLLSFVYDRAMMGVYLTITVFSAFSAFAAGFRKEKSEDGEPQD